MPSNWTRCCGSVRSDLEITRKQLLHTFFTLNDHYQVTASTPICSPQLPPEIVMKAGAPAIRGAAGGYSFLGH
jgi:hypothetical protein